MKRLTIAIVLLTAALASAADLLRIDDRIVTKNDTLSATLTPPASVQGGGQLTLTWTDSYGRTVTAMTLDVDVAGDAIPVTMPLDRAVAMQNFLEAKLVVGDQTLTDRQEFIVTPESTLWDDYQVIMYNAYRTPAQQRALWDIGITAGKISSNGTMERRGGQRWYQYGFPFYCDQIATAFYAAYHTPAQNPKQKKLLDAKDAYRKDRSRKEPFFRDPCFDDEEALADACNRLSQAVQAQMRFRPFFYAHTDEGGVADLPSAWDFCFCPRSLAAFRAWLKGQYSSLEALNAQWETSFASWDEVAPFTTDEMMARGGTNFSPWADHRHFMNESFANVLRVGTEAVEKVDPTALAGLVGCQMPSAFGGYNYWLLSRVMTAIEPYNIGNNREIWRSFAPKAPATTTGFGADDEDIWRLWYQALHGDLGVIIYDEKYSYLDRDGKPTELARKIAPTYKALTAGIARQIAHMDAVNDPVAIHYSHPSITAHWMFEAMPEGQDWINRGSAAERLKSAFLRLRESFVKILEDNLRTYTFVAYAQLEDGSFDRMDKQVLLLPQSIAMSQAECDAVRRFVQRGGTVIADCRTALMDEHCKMLQAGRLDDLFGIRRISLDASTGSSDLQRTGTRSPIGRLPATLEGVRTAERVQVTDKAAALYADAQGVPAVIVRDHGKGRTIYLNALVTDYHRWRLVPPQGQSLKQLVSAILDEAGVQPQFGITTADGKPVHGVEIFPYRSGELTLLALHRNYQLRVSELGPPEYRRQTALEQPLSLQIDLRRRYAVYNQRTGEYLGRKSKVTIDLPKLEPLIFALLPEAPKQLTLSAAATAARGRILTASLNLDARRLGDTHAFHVQVLDPAGKLIRPLQQNLLAPKGRAEWKVPFALSDAPGEYTLVARDVATGLTARHTVKVE